MPYPVLQASISVFLQLAKSSYMLRYQKNYCMLIENILSNHLRKIKEKYGRKKGTNEQTNKERNNKLQLL